MDSELRERLVEKCNKYGLEAFVAGSRARGTEDPDSDLDIVVINGMDNKYDADQLATEFADDLGVSFRINIIDDFSVGSLVQRVQEGEPFGYTLYEEMIPLTLSQESRDDIEPLPSSPPEKAIQVHKNSRYHELVKACAAISHAIMFDGNRMLAEHGQTPVPPKELPNQLAAYDEEFASLMDQVVALQKNKISTEEFKPSELLRELTELFFTYHEGDMGPSHVAQDCSSESCSNIK